MKIKQGDSVQVVAGDDAGPAPHKVIQALGEGKLLVEGINRVFKHVRRGHPKSPQGGRLNLEMPIDSSNCLLYCDSCNRGTRAGYRYLDNGGKERFCRKCGSSLGTVSPPKARYAAKSS